MSATTVNSVDAAVALIDRWIDEWAAEEAKKVEVAVSVALKKVDKEMAKFQRAEIQKVYYKAIKKFYEDYHPHVYTNRTGSLYDLLTIQEFDDSNKVGWDYDPTKMVSTRKGMPGGKEYLFETVFGEGWHGGADKIAPQKAAIHRKHPNPGTPYYRTPPKGKRRYTKWTRHPAERAEKSPYNMVQEMIAELDEPGGKFWTEYHRLADKYISEAVAKA